MHDVLTHAALKSKQRELRDGFPDTLGLRVHRALSWLGRAEAESGDPDAQFLFAWIAFNAAYAEERDVVGERSAFRDFFEKLVRLDPDRRIYDAIWSRFPGPIRLLLTNRYVFEPFWKHRNDVPGYENWEERFEKAAAACNVALARSDTPRVLSLVFDRLYVLRNQLVHGGATWASSVNRDQVRDGAAILMFLLPIFLDVMMSTPDEDWGRPFYPVVE